MEISKQPHKGVDTGRHEERLLYRQENRDKKLANINSETYADRDVQKTTPRQTGKEVYHKGMKSKIWKHKGISKNGNDKTETQTTHLLQLLPIHTTIPKQQA